jgi:ATP-dependent Clp protease ATP-binding subunit ClpA
MFVIIQGMDDYVAPLKASDELQQALLVAAKAARKYANQEIAVMHLLYGMCQDRQSTTCALLKVIHVRLGKFRQDTLRRIQLLSLLAKPYARTSPPLADELIRLLQSATTEAIGANFAEVQNVHFFMGALREKLGDELWMQHDISYQKCLVACQAHDYFRPSSRQL